MGMCVCAFSKELLDYSYIENSPLSWRNSELDPTLFLTLYQ